MWGVACHDIITQSDILPVQSSKGILAKSPELLHYAYVT
jgi:hypothetical protein